jgi:hypothetical protein
VASPSREGPFDHLVGAASSGVYVCTPPGKRTVNTEPLPGSLATVTSPPIMRASLRAMARPRPVPPSDTVLYCFGDTRAFILALLTFTALSGW